MDARKFLEDLRLAGHRGGLRGGLGFLRAQNLHHHLLYYAHRAAWPSATFAYEGRSYPYWLHKYNHTWRNERQVEVPIIWELVRAAQGARILEVGNVLQHYFQSRHDVVDKYELAPGIMNEDVVEFRPERPYDLIVSISTLEHVGWDENPRRRGKLDEALRNLREACLAPGGRLVATMPLGYNPDVDDLARSTDARLSRRAFLKRTSNSNDWIQVATFDEARTGARPGWPGASSILVAYAGKIE